MRKSIEFLSSVPFFAHTLGAGSIAAWVLKAIWLDHIPAPYGFITDLGRVAEGVLSAVFAGYVFYILFAMWPEHQERNVLKPLILERVRTVIGNCTGLLDEIGHASGIPLRIGDSTHDAIIEAAAATNMSTHPRQIVDLQGTRATWIQFFNSRRVRTAKAVQDVVTHGRYTSAELIGMLVRIQNCSIFVATESLDRFPFANTDLKAFGPDIADYVAQIRELAHWYDNHRLPGTPSLLQ